MNKKYLIIGIVAIISIIAIIAVGTIAYTSLQEPGTQTIEFKKFNITASAEIEFNISDDEYRLFSNDEKGYFIAEIMTDEGLDGVMDAASYKLVLEFNPKLNDLDGFNVTNKSDLTVYQISNPTNATKYVAVYNPEGVYIVVGAPDLESLKLMISSIVFKKIVEKEDNNTQHTNTETENTNEIPNESDYGDSEWFYDEAVELYYYYDENGNRIYV